ncbi:MAG: fatty acid desaturase [Pirellulales bacterium]
MSKKPKNKRSSARHYRQTGGAVVQPVNEQDVAALLSGHAPTEASSVLKWNSGRKNVAHPSNVSVANALWLGLIHVGALAALMPSTFTWSALIATVVLHWICGGVGICLGFHRMLTHGSFSTYRWVRSFIATVGCLAGEGPPMMWVANHRLHHARSDQEGDPHSPRDGAWWSHVFWLAYTVGGKDQKEYYRKWAPDLQRDRFMRFLNYAFLPINVLMSLALAGIGYAIGGTPVAISWLVWAVCVRMVFVLHSTWLVNSASHMWGYRNYETRDDSRNNWWVALITYGEGWHNNHHAHPRMAKHGHRWWEVDITFMTIRLMKALGLVWDVVDYRSRSEKQAA